ncbi:O-antigen ligase family protein [Candidatus Kaiserbacteria bacterium]|nr:O-antigen ligase family protein [Candidatus Kaiserbacteria bacterium]
MAEAMTDRLGKTFSYLLLAPAVIPLVYVSGLVYPYVATKTFLLQGIGIIALSVFAYLALSGRPFYYERLRNRLTWIPIALLTVAYVASYFGVDFYRSFWGLFDRGDSLLTLTVITTFFYLILISAPTPFGVGAPTSDVGADRQLLERLVRTVAAVAGIVALIAVLQWVTATLGGKPWFLPPITGRIGGTFGNAAFLAGYLGMSLFVILIAMRDSIGFWRQTYKIFAVLSVLAIIFAATRGTILALVIAGAVALAYAAVSEGERVKRMARYGFIALAIFMGLFFVFRTELMQASFEPIRRMASISLSDSTVTSRLFVWQNVGSEALQRPWSGYGAESIASIFNRIYDPSSIVEQWFDRSHNAFLDYFVQYGIFGLALYFAVIIAFAVSSVRIYRSEPPGLLNVGFLFLLLILAYSIQNFFVFDTPSSLWLLYALFALCISATTNVPTTAPAWLARLPTFVPALACIAVFSTIIPAVAFPLYANIMLTRGYLYHLIDVPRANAYFERGLALGTYADLEYGYQAYSMYTDRQAVQLLGQNRISAYEYALSVLTANFNKYPYDARTATYLGHVLDTAPPEVVVNNDFDMEVLKRAIELSPLRAQAWYMTTNIYLRKADILPAGSKEKEPYYREAIKILETYTGKEPTLPVPRYILATIYYALDDAETAGKWADSALPLYTKPDTAAAKPAVKYYIAIRDWRNAARFLADLVEKNPSDYDVLYDLAKVTYLAGDPAKSLRIVEELRKKNPEIIGTDQNFLNVITAYESQK